MYVPRQFDEPRVDTLHALIRAHPLGTLVTLTPDGLDANHTPFEIDAGPGEFGTLRGHLARANRQWRDAVDGVEALAVFQGPERYISPSWYATKQETGKVVPTWNYAVVHARGPMRVIEDRAWLRAFVERLTTRYEAGRATPWQVGDAPADFIESLLGAIVGIEIPIMRLTGKWKASQNRPDGDRDGVVEGLRREGGDAAAAMAELVRNATRG